MVKSSFGFYLGVGLAINYKRRSLCPKLSLGTRRDLTLSFPSKKKTPDLMECQQSSVGPFFSFFWSFTTKFGNYDLKKGKETRNWIRLRRHRTLPEGPLWRFSPRRFSQFRPFYPPHFSSDDKMLRQISEFSRQHHSSTRPPLQWYERYAAAEFKSLSFPLTQRVKHREPNYILLLPTQLFLERRSLWNSENFESGVIF